MDKDKKGQVVEKFDTLGDNISLKGSRNFRHAPEIENFYRFVNEYNLRREAKMIFDKVMQVLGPKKKNSKKMNQ